MEARFRDQDITLANGVAGQTIEFESADPVNHHQALRAPHEAPVRLIDGKLFPPAGGDRAGAGDDPGPAPVVILTPGSLGVSPGHLAHAATLTSLGLAVFVIDPFGPRAVTSTVADQTQYSFAASAIDVLAALRTLAHQPGIDPTRIGAQGHSRGGSAVLTAASRRFADPVLGRTGPGGTGPGVPPLRAVYAAYPWCGQQFEDPDVGDTVVRAIIGERDDWCSPQQVQGHMRAIRLLGGDASFRLVAGAGHSFDRDTEVEVIADASVSPGAPTTYLADDGAMIHPLTGVADPALTDRDVMRWAVKAGFGRRGATIGSQGDQPDVFRADMVAFWSSNL